MINAEHLAPFFAKGDERNAPFLIYIGAFPVSLCTAMASLP